MKIRYKALFSVIATLIIQIIILLYKFSNDISANLVFFGFTWIVVFSLTLMGRVTWKRIILGFGKGMDNMFRNTARLGEGVVKRAYEQEQRKIDIDRLGESIARSLKERDEEDKTLHGY